MDRKNWLLVIGALVLVAGVGIFGSQAISDERSAKSVPIPVSKGPAQATVELTSHGTFEPDTVTIKSGQTVKWVNNSGGLMWVASNPHPTHTDLPGFDQKQVMHSGDSWEFTFIKAGRFGYHDHLEPSRRGTVIVEAN